MKLERITLYQVGVCVLLVVVCFLGFRSLAAYGTGSGGELLQESAIILHASQEFKDITGAAPTSLRELAQKVSSKTASDLAGLDGGRYELDDYSLDLWTEGERLAGFIRVRGRNGSPNAEINFELRELTIQGEWWRATVTYQIAR